MNAVAPSDAGIETLGPYRVLHPLEMGDARDVLLARDEAGRYVVLKSLGAQARDQALLDSTIADDARSYARLSHANLVKVVDFFSAEGCFVVALEYVEGGTLDVFRASIGRARPDLDPQCWIYVASCVFAALAAAHGAVGADGRPAPIVHGNVKPSHVHVAWDGTIKLGGFSMASVVRIAQENHDGPSAKEARYLAPEQSRKGRIGGHTDVYSAMLVLRELLDGVRADVDARVRDAIRAGLEPDPARRISAARARDILRSAIDMAAAHDRFAAALASVRSEPVLPPMEPASSDDAPTRVRPPTEEELRAISGVLQVAAPIAPAAPSVEPRRPPPLPPRALARRPAPVDVELELEPDPEPDPEPAAVLAPAPPPAPDPTPAPALAFAPPPDSAPAIAPEPPSRSSQQVPASSRTSLQQIRTRVLTVPMRVRLLHVSIGLATCLVVATLVARAPARSTPRAPRQPSAEVPPPSPVAAQEPAPASTPTAAATLAAPAASAQPASNAPTDPPSAGSGSGTASDSAIPAWRGQLLPPASASGHRIYVDGRPVGEGTAPILVGCGPHTVRVGTAGRLQQVDVPCGERLELSR